MICSSVNLLRFMSASFAGEQANFKVRTFQGSRSLSLKRGRPNREARRTYPPSSPPPRALRNRRTQLAIMRRR